jgi:hypothetical protein
MGLWVASQCSIQGTPTRGPRRTGQAGGATDLTSEKTEVTEQDNFSTQCKISKSPDRLGPTSINMRPQRPMRTQIMVTAQVSWS